jgi:hypothetical protein
MRKLPTNINGKYQNVPAGAYGIFLDSITCNVALQ